MYVDTARQAMNEIKGGPMVEVDGSVLYFQPCDYSNSFEFGYATNNGLKVIGTYDYDSYFSIDENLQAMMETMENELQV